MHKKQFFNRILFLLIVFNIIIAYLIVNYNLRYNKVEIPNSEIISKLSNYDSVRNIISDSSAFPSNIIFRPNEFSLLYNDSLIFKYKLDDRVDLNSISNSSYKSMIFSLSFLRNYILNDNYDLSNFSSIDSFIQSIILYSESFITNDYYILHDHPVSERLESLLLYISFKIRNNLPISELELNHIKHLVYLLCQDGYFTYYNNHGLIQIKSLLRAGIILNNDDMINKSKQFLNDTYLIYANPDGSLLESASQYQLYIFKLYSEFNRLLKKIGDNSLERNVNNQRKFISNLIAKDGFLQGFGDSYNVVVDEKEKLSLKSNSVFSFNNGISGLNSPENNFNFLFISADNKPNVHKLPEDLSLYLYYDGPFFINSGTYSYNLKDQHRKFFLTRQAQNGVKFINKDILNSDVQYNGYLNNKFSFSGLGINIDSLSRHIIFDIQKSLITIIDSSMSSITTNFILHPEVLFEVIDNKKLILNNHNQKIIFNSNQKIEIDKTIISTSLFNIDTTTRLIINGNNEISIELVTPLSDMNDIQEIFKKDHQSKNLRAKTVNDLQDKYPLTLIIRKINMSYIGFILGILGIIIVSVLIPSRIKNFILPVLFIVTLYNVLIGGEIFVFWFYKALTLL